MGKEEKLLANIALIWVLAFFVFLASAFYRAVVKVDNINRDGVVVLCDRGQITLVDNGRITRTEVQCSDQTRVYFAPEQDDHESSERPVGE